MPVEGSGWWCLEVMCDGAGREVAEVTLITGSEVNRRVSIVILYADGVSGRGGGALWSV